MKKKLLLIIPILALCILASFTGTKNNIERLDAQTFKNKVDQNNTVLIDIRRVQEFQNGHIANAINIDFNSQGLISEITKHKGETELLIYSKDGKESTDLAVKLTANGFGKIYLLDGGIVAYKAEGFTLEK